MDHHNNICDLWIALLKGHRHCRHLDVTMTSNFFATSKTIFYTLQ